MRRISSSSAGLIESVEFPSVSIAFWAYLCRNLLLVSIHAPPCCGAMPADGVSSGLIDDYKTFTQLATLHQKKKKNE